MGIPQAAAAQPRRRSDAGQLRLQQRDLDRLLLIADHYAAPYDLLAAALSAAYPPPGGKPGWTVGTIRAILANPKYTGHMVFVRRRTRNGKTISAPMDQ